MERSVPMRGKYMPTHVSKKKKAATSGARAPPQLAAAHAMAVVAMASMPARATDFTHVDDGWRWKVWVREGRLRRWKGVEGARGRARLPSYPPGQRPSL